MMHHAPSTPASAYARMALKLMPCAGLAGALGRRGRGALKKSDPGGGAGRSKKVGGADFSQNCTVRGVEPWSRTDCAVVLSTKPPDHERPQT